jgi:hypothetical protein
MCDRQERAERIVEVPAPGRLARCLKVKKEMLS